MSKLPIIYHIKLTPKDFRKVLEADQIVFEEEGSVWCTELSIIDESEYEATAKRVIYKMEKREN